MAHWVGFLIHKCENQSLDPHNLPIISATGRWRYKIPEQAV